MDKMGFSFGNIENYFFSRQTHTKPARKPFLLNLLQVTPEVLLPYLPFWPGVNIFLNLITRSKQILGSYKL